MRNVHAIFDYEREYFTGDPVKVNIFDRNEPH